MRSLPQDVMALYGAPFFSASVCGPGCTIRRDGHPRQRIRPHLGETSGYCAHPRASPGPAGPLHRPPFLAVAKAAGSVCMEFLPHLGERRWGPCTIDRLRCSRRCMLILCLQGTKCWARNNVVFVRETNTDINRVWQVG